MFSGYHVYVKDEVDAELEDLVLRVRAARRRNFVVRGIAGLIGLVGFVVGAIVHGSARASLGVAVFFVFVLAGGTVLKRYEVDIHEIE